MSLIHLVDIWFILTSMISNNSDTEGEIHLPQKHHMLISISNLLCYIDLLNSLLLVAQKVILECVGKICISIFHLIISHANSLICKDNEIALKNKQTNKKTQIYMHLQYYPKRSIWNVEFYEDDASFGTDRIQQGSVHGFSQESHRDTEHTIDFNAFKLQKGFPRISPKTNICRREM